MHMSAELSTGSNDARCSELFDSSKGVTDV